MLVDDIAKSGGLITLDDLARYQPKVREVLRAKYETAGHAWEVLTSPPPSSGGVAIIEALNMLKDVPLKNWDDVESVHMAADTMRQIVADRAAYLTDPDFSNVPVAGLTDPCAIAPGRRPLSSMTPTILLRDGQLSFVTGSPGGPTIISATLLSVINWMRLGMDAQSAINAPRFHHQWLPDEILMEQDFSEDMEKALQARGFAVKRR